MQMTPLSLIAALMACAPITSTPDDEDGVAFDQKTIVDGPTIMPMELLEDSRCPSNADCAWPGQVRIKIKWFKADEEVILEMTSGHPTPIADGALTLASVKPIRKTTGKIARDDYRFTFSFAGGL